MTMEELEQMCLDHDVAIGYLGWATTTRAIRESGVSMKWACSIQPAQSSTRWRPNELFIRGKGPTMVAALDDAATQLAAFLISRAAERPKSDDDD